MVLVVLRGVRGAGDVVAWRSLLRPLNRYRG